ncbi:thiamine pyrophosphate-binding protein [Nannocystis radixulma]|uniref:Thiamine pyrophosphate-binding protein n=1 Tax=Nannocystis radixulma TaxID=2995305 RepID=A0ABT5BFI9_9BACT|nr:thiamine pyrophosphate-binding protein [Nannocystis radixulma]MDC0672909.1 thiamine pyrophosphate-binding protein [Nannocystis radixulma]
MTAHSCPAPLRTRARAVREVCSPHRCLWTCSRRHIIALLAAGRAWQHHVFVGSGGPSRRPRGSRPSRARWRALVANARTFAGATPQRPVAGGRLRLIFAPRFVAPSVRCRSGRAWAFARGGWMTCCGPANAGSSTCERGPVCVRRCGAGPGLFRALHTYPPTLWALKVEMKKVAAQLIEVVREFGVDTVYGIPGGAIASMYAELEGCPDIRVVTAKHEANAVFLAMGHSLATGRPGVVLTTSGPGVTNALTGLASANADGIPVVVIAGEVARVCFGRGALQEGSVYGFDAVGMARRVCNSAVQLARADAAVGVFRQTMAAMTSGRPGAAFVSLPLDVANARVASSNHFGEPEYGFRIDRVACERAMALLLSAERPLVFAGAGARGTENRARLIELVRRTGAAVAVTPKGKGTFPEDHPRYLGLFGFGGHESVVDYLRAKPDVVLVCGAGLNDFATNAWSPLLAASKAFIQIDIDAAQFGKNYPVDIGLLGPLDEVIGAMLAVEGEHVERTPGPRLTLQPAPTSSTGRLTTIDVVQAMNEVCPVNSFFTSDMGEHLGVALHFLRVREQGSFVTCLGFGSMGSGICVAAGLAFGARDQRRRAYAICGDGGMLMSGGELATAVQWQLPVTFVVINDSRLNMCHHGILDQYGRTPDFSTQLVDFAGVAAAMGATGRVVETFEQLVAGLRDLRDGPVVLDVRVDPEVRLCGSQRVAALKQFTE